MFRICFACTATCSRYNTRSHLCSCVHLLFVVIELLSGSPRVSLTHSQMQENSTGNISGGPHVCPHGHHHHQATTNQDTPPKKRSSLCHSPHLLGECSTVKFPAKADFYGSVASRPRTSPYPLVPVTQALETVLQQAPLLPPTSLSSLTGTYLFPFLWTEKT